MSTVSAAWYFSLHTASFTRMPFHDTGPTVSRPCLFRLFCFGFFGFYSAFLRY